MQKGNPNHSPDATPNAIPNANPYCLESFGKSKEKVLPWIETWQHYYHKESQQGES